MKLIRSNSIQLLNFPNTTSSSSFPQQKRKGCSNILMLPFKLTSRVSLGISLKLYTSPSLRIYHLTRLKSNFSTLRPSNNSYPNNVKFDQNSSITLENNQKNIKKRSLIQRVFNLSHQEANSASSKEIWRLLKLASKDLPLFILAMTLLTLSAAIIMSLPKVTGTILDATRESFFMNKISPGTGTDTTDTNDDDNNNHSYASDIKENSIPKYSDLRVYDLPIDTFLFYLAGALTVATGATFARTLLMRIIGENLVSRMRSRFMKNILRQDGEFYDKNKVGDLISRLSSDSYVVSKSITYNMSDGVKHSLVLTSSLGMMFYLSSTLSMVMLAFAPPLLFASWIYGLKVRALSRQLQQATGDLTKVAEQELNSIKTIQCSNAEPRETHRYGSQIQKVWNVSFRDALTNATFFSVTGILGNTTFLITLALGARLVMDGSMTIGDLTAYMIYTEYCGSATFGIASFYTELFKGAGAASRLFEILDIQPKINPIKGRKVKFPMKGHIKFDNVTFSYPTRPDNIIFKNLSFEIKPGANVCIVGPSGKGKSTIASLLLKMYEPNEGKIFIDGVDIKDISTASLRRHLGYVQQEPILMEGSIYDNIIYSLPLNERKKIKPMDAEFVAQRANCDFIGALPLGMNTQVGARGSLLSGGQKQKLAIARALIKDPGILILDEATSALDAASEAMVNVNLNRWAVRGTNESNITRISIAHRASTIKACDEVIVLGYEGNVVEQGSTLELWDSRNSWLWKLVRARKDSEEKKEKEVQILEVNGHEENEGDKTPAHRLNV